MYLRGLKFLRTKLLQDTRGSISVLTIGLFSLLLITTLVLSDISSVYLAKRTLTLASEAAVQRGLKNLDQAAYYSDKYNLTRMLDNTLGNPEEDPGIPIDCGAGASDAREVLNNWQGRDGSSSRVNVSTFTLTDFQCDGFQIYLESAARVRIPFPLPFLGVDEVHIHGSAGAIGERAETNNFSGFDIG
jgi:hypothetical protein